jgi:hypothetical protein
MSGEIGVSFKIITLFRDCKLENISYKQYRYQSIDYWEDAAHRD